MNATREQWIGSYFWWTIALQASIFLLAWLIFRTQMVSVAMVGIALFVFVLALRRLDIAMLIVIAEMIAGSHGHLLSTEVIGFTISLRMILFLAVMAAWGISFIKQSSRNHFRKLLSDERMLVWIPLWVAITVGLIVGVIKNGSMVAFQDGNAYISTLLIFPWLTVTWERWRLRSLLQVVAASSIWISFLSLGIFYVFSHFQIFTLTNTYEFLRDTRMAEITRVVGQIHRVFLPSQLSVILIGLFFLAWTSMLSTVRQWLITGVLLLVSSSVVMFLSLSRSYWVGVFAGLIVFIILMLVRAEGKQRWYPITKVFGTFCASSLFGLLLVVGVLLFPFPNSFGTSGDLSLAFSSRTGIGDAGISSRWKLLPLMLETIREQPFLGSGFGKTITFATDDPRARSQSEDGLWTTYAMEWGWLELWLKMGVLGIAGYLWLGYFLMRRFFLLIFGPNRWIGVGLFSALVFLFVTHFFSPYLNHPIGIAWMLFFFAFLQTKTPPDISIAAPLFSDAFPKMHSVQASIPMQKLIDGENT